MSHRIAVQYSCTMSAVVYSTVAYSDSSKLEGMSHYYDVTEEMSHYYDVIEGTNVECDRKESLLE
jgi:hypothetical protein